MAVAGKSAEEKPAEVSDYEHLLWLCRRGMLYEAEAWLEEGHSVAPPEDARGCPLIIATRKGFHSMVQLLLRFDCSAEQKLDAFREAVEDGKVEIARLLVDAGAPVNELPYWCLEGTVSRDLLQYLVDHGLDMTQDDRLAHILTGRRIKPLLGLLMQNRKRFPSWEIQAAKALCAFVDKRDLKWVSLMIWAKADPLMKVHRICEDSEEEPDEDMAECAAEIALHRGEPEVFQMLKVTPTPAQANELLRAVWFDPKRELIEMLLSAGADLNAHDSDQGTFLHRQLSSFAWSCSCDFVRRDPKKEVEVIAWLIRKGAKWIPPDRDRDLDYLRRNCYRGKGEFVVEVIRLLDAGDACEKELLRTFVDKPKMRGWVRHHNWDLFQRLLP